MKYIYMYIPDFGDRESIDPCVLISYGLASVGMDIKDSRYVSVAFHLHTHARTKLTSHTHTTHTHAHTHAHAHTHVHTHTHTHFINCACSKYFGGEGMGGRGVAF